MELMTKELEEVFSKQGATESKSEEEIMVRAHYFAGSWDWWVAKFYPKNRIFFGLVRGQEVQVGYFSLNEMEKFSCNVIARGGIEWDRRWQPRSLAAVREELAHYKEVS